MVLWALWTFPRESTRKITASRVLTMTGWKFYTPTYMECNERNLTVKQLIFLTLELRRIEESIPLTEKEKKQH